MTARRFGLLALAAATLTTAAVTAVAGPGSAPADQRPRVILAHGKERLPSTTAQDWVSYGDRTVIATVTSETQLAASDEEIEAGEGYLSRTVTLNVQQQLWARSGAPALPAGLTITADGWAFKGTQKTPIAETEGSRLEVGHTYLLTLDRLAGGAWTTLGGGARVPYDNNVVGNGEYEGSLVTPSSFARSTPASGPDAGPDSDSTAPASVVENTAGQAGSSVATLLAQTAPDPVAQQNFALDPIARRAAVVGATVPQDTYCSLAAPLDRSAGSNLTAAELGSLLEEVAGKATGSAAGSAEKLAAYYNGDTTVTLWQATAAKAMLSADLNNTCRLTVSLDPTPTTPTSPSPTPSSSASGNTGDHTTG
ncbi:hypothetical protein AB0D08_34040 [Kitasatospora sp. NPDC048540]|uniref:hypothetical protein n=1 Tax=unclassified Kitasatospora TaxID=2633591 RepID=UPI00068BEB9A|nr:hypothetical protein [Kitasatospora sp. MBT63]